MKKLYLLLPILFLIYWGCEEEQDTTPPTVSIISPQDGLTVTDSVTIICMSTDNEGVEKVELWVDGVNTGVSDNSEPYSLFWYPTTYETGLYILVVRSYDTSGNTNDSDPISVFLEKTVELWGETYLVSNTTNLSLHGNNLTGSIPPEIGNLINLENVQLGNNNLTGSIPSEIGNLINLRFNLILSGNELTGSIPPEIGNLTNLDGLFLYSNNLTGSIPPEIGNLSNLRYLHLDRNQLTGEIPESICDLNNLWFDNDPVNHIIFNDNQLCPPYPSCIEDYVGEQDTSDCP